MPRLINVFDPIDGNLSNSNFSFSTVISPSELSNRPHGVTFDAKGNMFWTGWNGINTPSGSNNAFLVGVDPVDGIFFNGNDIFQTYDLRPILAGGLPLLDINLFTDIVADQQGNIFIFDAGVQILHLLKPLYPLLTSQGDAFLQAHRKNFNEGANHALVIEKKGTKRIVVGFDLLSTTQSVSSAKLILALKKPAKDWGPAGGMLDAHLLAEIFTEGNGFGWEKNAGQGAFGNGPGVTWNCASDSDINNRKPDCEGFWKGGAQAISSVTDTAGIINGQTGEVLWDVTNDVQNAIAEQSTAIQWLIRKNQEHRKGQVVFHSKEGAGEVGDMTKAPRLELEFVD